MMYKMYRNLNPKTRNWNIRPGKNEVNEADDIKRINHYRNLVSYSDASEIETAQFNTLMLDLLGVIFLTHERLSFYFSLIA